MNKTTINLSWLRRKVNGDKNDTPWNLQDFTEHLGISEEQFTSRLEKMYKYDKDKFHKILSTIKSNPGSQKRRKAQCPIPTATNIASIGISDVTIDFNLEKSTNSNLITETYVSLDNHKKIVKPDSMVNATDVENENFVSDVDDETTEKTEFLEETETAEETESAEETETVEETEAVEEAKSEKETKMELLQRRKESNSELLLELEKKNKQLIEARYSKTKELLEAKNILQKLIQLKERIQKSVEEYKENELLIAENNELFGLATAEQQEIVKEIEALRTIQLYCGDDENADGYDYSLTDISIPEGEISNKIMMLMTSELINNLTVLEVKALAKIICARDKIAADNNGKTVKIISAKNCFESILEQL